MLYRLTVIYAIYNAGSVTDDITFDNFYEMQDYILENSEGWHSYNIAVV